MSDAVAASGVILAAIGIIGAIIRIPGMVERAIEIRLAAHEKWMRERFEAHEKTIRERFENYYTKLEVHEKYTSLALFHSSVEDRAEELRRMWRLLVAIARNAGVSVPDGDDSN